MSLNSTSGGGASAQGQSATSFGFAVLAGIGAAVGQVAIFALLKDKLPKLYQPKSFLVSERQRIPPLHPGPWQWILPIFQIPGDDLLQKAGLDAFFLCRYLILMMKILGPPSLIFIPILLPINYYGGNNIEANLRGTDRNRTQGLDVLTMANIRPEVYDRLWAHLLLAICLIVWICYIIVTELQYFIKVRQTYLTSPQHRLRASASTVLVQALPKKYVDKEVLAELFDVFPGGIRNIWVNRDYTELIKMIKERAKIAKKLEQAETQLIQKCWKAHLDKEKLPKKAKNSNGSQVDGPPPDADTTPENSGDGLSFNNPGQVHHNVDDAVDAINRGYETVDTDLATTRKNVLGRGFVAVTQGVKGGMRKVISREEDRQSGPRSGLRRLIPGTGRSKEVSRDIKDTKDEFIPLETMPTLTEERRSTESKQNEILPFDSYYNEDKHFDARWKEFIKEDDRPRMRVKPRWKWLPSLINPAAVKVDAIYHCRRELARLNRLIEQRQQPKWETHYPKMNSAFIQFNNQAAAHMACQSVAHHTPNFMRPRTVEISPGDVIWGNLSIPGWQRYLRKGVIFLICLGLMIAWTPLITVFGSLAQLDALRKTTSWLHWLRNWPGGLIGVIQGILPPILIGLSVYLLGLILRLLVKHAGAPTRMLVELSVQKYYFVFSFLQYFVIVTVANAISVLIAQLSAVANNKLDPLVIPELLQQNIPKSSNYFLSNIFIQSFAQSAAGLLQIGPLFLFVVMLFGNPIGRKKFNRRTKLEQVNWGTQYAQYTTFACIAMIYSVASPLILPLTFIGFGVWWASTRYQMLFIYQYTVDTGGLLFPTAVKQLFTGVYVLELFLLGFFIVTATVPPKAGATRWGIVYAIIMLVVVLMTMVFQQIIRTSYGELWRYLPITLEDDAVKRDEEFERLLAQRHSTKDEQDMMQGAAEGGPVDHDDHNSVEEEEEAKRQNSENTDVEAQRDLDTPKDINDIKETTPKSRNGGEGLKVAPQPAEKRSSWADRSRREQEQQATAGASFLPIPGAAGEFLNKAIAAPVNILNPNEKATKEQHLKFAKEADALYGNIPDDLEELTAKERDALLSRAFKHEALRAKRPCIWLPRDRLGVSDDEVRNVGRFSGYIWVSNEKQQLDLGGRCEYTGPPPDFDQVDLIQL